MIKNYGSDKTLLVIFILGLALRILFTLYLEDKIYWLDGFAYDGLATRLLEGKGYVNQDGVPTAFRAPAYPFFLAFLYATLGHHFWLVRIVQCLIDCATILILFSVSNSIFSRKVAIIAAFIYSIYPLFIYSANTFFPTTLFSLLLSLVILFLIKLDQKLTLSGAASLGIIVGLAALTVPTILFFFPLGIIWLYIAHNQARPKVLFHAAITFLAMLLILSPWLLRNYRIFNKPFVIATNGGYNFWMGNNEKTTASTGNTIKFPASLSQQLAEAGNEVAQERIFYQQGFQFIQQNPARFVKLTFLKVLNLWRLYPNPDTGYKISPTLSKILSIVTYGPVLLLAIAGFILSFSQRKKYVCLMLCLFLSFTVGYALFITKVRFRLPLEPYLIILASFAMTRFWNDRKKIMNRLHI